MATKSDNTKGNPYHDEGGKFTSADGQSSGSTAEEKVKGMGFNENNANETHQSYLNEIDKYGSTNVGRNNDTGEAIDIAKFGDKFYARTYQDKENGWPSEDDMTDVVFKDENGNYIDGFDSFEELINALNKDGYALYDDLKKQSNVSEQIDDGLTEEELNERFRREREAIQKYKVLGYDAVTAQKKANIEVNYDGDFDKNYPKPDQPDYVPSWLQEMRNKKNRG